MAFRESTKYTLKNMQIVSEFLQFLKWNRNQHP